MAMSEMNRSAMEQQLLRGLAQALTKEQYAKLRGTLSNMSDYDFFQVMQEAIHHVPEGHTAKEQAKLIGQLIEANGVTVENSALNEVPAEWLSETDNSVLLKTISESYPSDTIRLTKDGDSKIIHLWKDNNAHAAANGQISIPSDLFFAETIPLLDCKIIVDERGYIADGAIIPFRVVVFNKYAEELREATEDTVVRVGAVIYDIGGVPGAAVVLPMCVVRGVDRILFDSLGYINLPNHLRTAFSKHFSACHVMQMFFGCLETWYGVQIALIHPVVRDVFIHPRMIVENSGKARGRKQAKRKVRYIREHILNAEALEKAIYGEDRQFTRRALIWYVIGHWRIYADGRKVFVRPYWKGALRDTKKNLSEREREIAQLYVEEESRCVT